MNDEIYHLFRTFGTAISVSTRHKFQILVALSDHHRQPVGMECLKAWLRCTSRAEDAVSHGLAKVAKVSSQHPWKRLDNQRAAV